MSRSCSGTSPCLCSQHPALLQGHWVPSSPAPEIQAQREAWAQQREQGQTSHGTENVRSVGTDGSMEPS